MKKGILQVGITALAALVSLSGCGAAIENLNAYKPYEIPRADIMPSKEAIKGGKIKVVIMSVDDSGFAAARSSNLGEGINRMIETKIAKDRAIEILDRSATQKFEDEIRLNEMNGAVSSDNALLDSANYAIAAELKNASFTSRFVQTQRWTDDKGKVHVIPAHYIYTAEVDGQIKIYELPSMRIDKIIPFSDNKRRSEDSKFLGKRAYVDNGLMSNAAEDAIHAARIELKNFFAPKGYLIEARRDGSDTIIKISLGSQDGIKEGDELEVLTRKRTTNLLTEEESVELHRVAVAKVSNQIQAKSAWAAIESEIDGEQIRLGDEVKVLYSKGFMDYMNDMGRLGNSLAK